MIKAIPAVPIAMPTMAPTLIPDSFDSVSSAFDGEGEFSMVVEDTGAEDEVEERRDEEVVEGRSGFVVSTFPSTNQTP
jgi:hypothetical protein